MSFKSRIGVSVLVSDFFKEICWLQGDLLVVCKIDVHNSNITTWLLMRVSDSDALLATIVDPPLPCGNQTSQNFGVHGIYCVTKSHWKL